MSKTKRVFVLVEIDVTAMTTKQVKEMVEQRLNTAPLDVVQVQANFSKPQAKGDAS